MRDERVFAYRSFNPELDTVRAFARIGVDWVCIYPSNTLNSLGLPYSAYGPTWLGIDTYDFGPLDRQIGELLDANPRVQIICMVDLNTPAWFVRQFGRAGGREAHDSFYDRGKVVSLERWRQATGAYLQAFLRHTEEHYPDSVRAYMLSCGGTCEWQDASMGEESASRRAAFRAWAQERGMPDPVDIPPASLRDHVTHDLLRDPQADAAALDYWRFCHRQIGDAILTMAGKAQEVIRHRAELGAFYGYIMEYGAGRLVSEGHLDYERVFSSPDLDFFVAPGSYGNRKMGGSSPFMVPQGTLRHHGKGFIQELDQRTHTAKRPAPWYTAAFNTWHDDADTVAGLRREFAQCLIEDVSFWWFDMWGGFYQEERVHQAIAQMKRIWDDSRRHRPRSTAQIAVVMDPESALYLDQASPRINTFTTGLAHTLSRLGAPSTVLSWGDLATLDLAQYRLVLFPNLFVMDEARERVLREKVCRDGRTVLWLYRPGVIRNGRYDESAMLALTGVGPSEPGIVTRPRGGWTSVVSTDPALTSGDLRAIARDAGVHLYSESDETLYASDRYLALHTATGGPRRIVLPRKVAAVTELFSGRVVARDTAVFEDALAAPDTRLYELV